MKYCLKCQNRIPVRIKINGKEKNLQNRKYCLECSPWGHHNTKKIHDPETMDNSRICRVCEKEYIGGHQKYKNICVSCRMTEIRKDKKQILVDYLGGECIVCCYNKCNQVLQFHHINPEEKLFGLSNSGTKKIEVLIAEADKCLLVCGNCHSEIHAGLIDVNNYIQKQLDVKNNNSIPMKQEKFYQPIVKISKRPAKETLEKLVWEMSCVKIGEMYGVSDNAVNKWCKFYGIEKPGRGDWEKIKFGKLEIPKT
jgi:hypothetical protein